MARDMAKRQWIFFTAVGLSVSFLFFYQFKDSWTTEFVLTVDEGSDIGEGTKKPTTPKFVPKVRAGNSGATGVELVSEHIDKKGSLSGSKPRTTTNIPQATTSTRAIRTPNRTTSGIPKPTTTTGVPRPRTTPVTKPTTSRIAKPKAQVDIRPTTSLLPVNSSRKEAGTPIRLCTTEERLDMVHQYCKSHQIAEKFVAKFKPQKSTASEKSHADVLDRIPDAEILRLSHELWLDPENKVIVCMHAKAGCSTWKTILANNSGNGTIGSAAVPGIHSLIFKRGMTCADDTKDAAEIRHRLRTWFKFAIVRHPLDRLVSGYNEKLAGTNTIYQKGLGRKILNQYQPHLPADVRRTGKGALFQDFIQFVLDTNPTDDHFKGPYEEKCHACLFDYDYIVKLETNAVDSRFIIGEKLKGRGLDSHTNINSHRTEKDPNAWQNGRDLSQHYRNLTMGQFQRLVERHDSDLGMYGYTMDAKTLQAKCEGKGRDGTGCC